MKRRDFLTLAALSTLIPYATNDSGAATAADAEDGKKATGRKRGRRSRRRRSKKDRPHVVCVLVDQLRKDSFDSWCSATRKLAGGGIVFETMRSVAPWTYPSTISMMSGLFPQQHGADGIGITSQVARFSDDLPLVQKLLKVHGYRTAAFVTNPFLKEWNSFHVGFDAFFSEYIKNTGARRPGINEFGVPSRMFANSVNEDIVKHFGKSKPKEPEFTYVHYIDVHGPWIEAPFRHDYESAVRFTDAKIIEIYEMFKERYEGDMLFFVTSDHGRHLDDDMEVGYGRKWREVKATVHEFNVRIPFALLPSKRIEHALTVKEPCSNIDFVPTLFDLLEIEPALEYPGMSLAAPLRGESLPASMSDRKIYAKHAAWGTACDGAVSRGRKYIRHLDPNNGTILHRRVFDLEKDPRETKSIGDDFGSVGEWLEKVASLRAFESTDQELPKDVEEQLRSLGYLGGSC